MNDTPPEMVVGAKGEPVELAPILGAINRAMEQLKHSRRKLLAAGDYNASFFESDIESLKDAAALVKRVAEVERERDALTSRRCECAVDETCAINKEKSQ